jgi:intein/homing endonuclease
MFVRPSNDSLSWYKLEFSDGKTLICTGDHPVFTDDGWIPAENLTKNHQIR